MFYLRFIENCAQRKLWTFKSRPLSAVIRFVIIPGPLDQFVQKLVALQPTDVCTDSFFFSFSHPGSNGESQRVTEHNPGWPQHD